MTTWCCAKPACVACIIDAAVKKTTLKFIGSDALHMESVSVIVSVCCELTYIDGNKAVRTASRGICRSGCSSDGVWLVSKRQEDQGGRELSGSPQKLCSIKRETKVSSRTCWSLLIAAPSPCLSGDPEAEQRRLGRTEQRKTMLTNKTGWQAASWRVWMIFIWTQGHWGQLETLKHSLTICQVHWDWSSVQALQFYSIYFCGIIAQITLFTSTLWAVYEV